MKKLLLLLLLTGSFAFAQADKVEPPFWWAGMNNPELQIMFYGKNIAQYTPSVSNNVVITGVVKTENPNYVFVTIDTKNVPASDVTFSFKNKNMFHQTIKEIPVVRYNDQTTRKIQQKFFQNIQTRYVQVISRLIQDQEVRLFDQN